MIDGHLRHTLLFKTLSRSPFAWLGALARTGLIIPYYHMVSDADVAHVRHLYRYKTPRQFSDDIDFLLKTRVPITLDQLLTCARTGRPLPARAFMLTFDDGFREMSDVVAPILLQKGLSATFFVNTAFLDNTRLCHVNQASLIVEHLRRRRSSALEQQVGAVLGVDPREPDIASRVLGIPYTRRRLLDEIADVVGIDLAAYLRTKAPYLSSAQVIGLLRQGFSIGAHSIDHPEYLSLSLDDQLDQTIESVTRVREMFGLDYGVFAFPFSDHGISAEFFARLSRTSVVDLTFGTAGLMDDSAPRHLQRFSLEKPLAAAERIVAFQQMRRLRHLMTGTPVVVRE
jgi:peptidoglycan/xylan/chitin deacetylase (PgdA/CDA1 family)